MDSWHKFRALTPRDNIDLHDYREALDYVFSNEDIRNVALSGSYGSGKSSVMRSYENIHKERKYIHISLSHFEEQGKVQTESDAAKCDDASAKTEDGKQKRSSNPATAKNGIDSIKTVNELEGKILNQLLHQIPSKKIPQSHFRIKDEISRRQRIISVSVLLLFVSLLIYVVCFSSWSAMIMNLSNNWLKSFFLFTTNQDTRLVCLGVVIALFGVGLFYLMKAHNFQNIFKKVDVKGIVGIEIFETKNDSYFDKYLNEVLYLFDHSDADVIVFEDLDRYDVTLIFQKLREINDLIYYKTKREPGNWTKTSRKPLRFFYLIRDDVFTSSDRSKFFDFIVPVVPYVDASNSCDQLLERFNMSGLENKFNKRFLQDVSLYLSDMRLVSNIVNEYIVYSGRLKDSGLNTLPERQLAIIIYKNLYPDDFDLLQRGQGYVFNLMNNKKLLIDQMLLQLDENAKDLRKKVEDSEQEQLRNIDELNALFFPLRVIVSSIGGEKITEEISQVELIKIILEHPKDVECYNQSSRWSSKLDVESLDAKMEANPDYLSRKANIENKETIYRRGLEAELRKLEQKALRLSTMSIAELLDQVDEKREKAFWECELPSYEPGNHVEKIQNSKGFTLLKYLIRNGYIDENYAAYVSYFYANSLTVRDRNFLLSLSDHSPLPYIYHLDHPGDVLDRLDSSDFIRTEIRNFDLLAHLLHNNHETELQEWLNICENDADFFLFLISFWRIGRETPHFIRFIFSKKPTWFNLWSKQDLLTETEWHSLALDALYYLNSHNLTEINQNGWLSDKISSDPDFLQIDNPDVYKIISGFKTLNVQFNQIAYREQDLPLVEAVYEENLYVLNLHMLKTFMKQFWGLSDDEAESRSYTNMLCNLHAPLSMRVFENMDSYVSVILNECDTRFSDSESAVIKLLNDNAVSEENKLNYIRRMDTSLTEICSIESQNLWETLITHRRVQYTWQNIADYFGELGDDVTVLCPELADFINSDTKKFEWKYKDLNERISKIKADNLRQAVLCSTDISLERYRAALAGMTYEYRQGFPHINIPDERMKIVFELRIIPMTKENVLAVRENYSYLWKDFVALTDASELLKLVNDQEVELSEEELSSILEDPRTDQKIALGLMDAFDGTIPVEGHTYPLSIIIGIIEKHFDEDELPWLLREFNKQDIKVSEVIIQYVRENLAKMVESAEELKFIPNKVYAACLDVLLPEKAKTLVPFLENSDFYTVCIDTKPKNFSMTPENQTILDYFKSHHWISSYSVKNGKLRVNPTIKKVW